jgi:carbon monoxide dehydrogenase subunit G
MAFKIREEFELDAPVEPVWRFLTDPPRVVVCVPGAELLESQDPRTFTGAVKVKVGPIAMSFKGTVKFAELDDIAHRARMTAEAREAGGAGSAKVTMVSQVSETPAGGSSVTVEAEVELVGKIVQFGRGMIEEVSRQLFRQFSACVKQNLESTEPSGRNTSTPAPTDVKPVNAASLGLRAIWALIARIFRRLAGKG